jgi:hypothetical protein
MRRRFAFLAAVLIAIPSAAMSQSPSLTAKANEQPVVATLPEVLATFLADSGVATRGLPWTTGNHLPIRWKSAEPAPTQYTMYPGITAERTGTASLATGDTASVEAIITVLGNAAGVQRVWVSWDMAQLPSIRGDSILLAAGFTLMPTKCQRETEGYSYGNLLFVVKAPGKKAAGLHEGWNCTHTDCTLAYQLYYRKVDAEQFDCAGT